MTPDEALRAGALAHLASRRCARRNAAVAASAGAARTTTPGPRMKCPVPSRTDTGVGTIGSVGATSCATSVVDRASEKMAIAIVFMASLLCCTQRSVRRDLAAVALPIGDDAPEG